MQLARFPDVKGLIHEAISKNGGITDKLLQDQWRDLIFEPLSKLNGDSSVPAQLVIVVDALDECEREDNIQRVLRLLINFRDIETVRFRVLITSRPEIPIRDGFLEVPDGEHQDFVLHDISQLIVDQDISILLKSQLMSLQTATPTWPRLARRASYQASSSEGRRFIYMGCNCL